MSQSSELSVPLNHNGTEHSWPDSLPRAFEQVDSSASGLSTDEAARRLAAAGPNAVGAGAEGHPIALIAAQFRSPLILILIAAAGLTLLVGEVTEALIIAGIVLASSTLGFAQEYRAANAMAALRARLSITASVLRGGKIETVSSAQVVPGDIVELVAGSLIVADGMLIEATELHVDEAALTGESFPVVKTAAGKTAGAETHAHMGTSVRSGTARMLVLVTGRRTQFGRVAASIAGLQPETAFEKGIRRFGLLMTQITLVIVGLIFPVGLMMGRPLLESLLFSAALAVGLTPELLPAVVSVTLARGAQKLAGAGVLVRRLVAIENLGSMNVLCTDKTGTLTEGTVRLDLATDVQGHPSDLTLRWAAINARLQAGMTNPIDGAIVAAAGDVPAVGYRKLAEIPYDFERQRLSVLVERDGERILVCKGSVASVTNRCGRYRSGEQVLAIADDLKAAQEAQVATWARDGYRVLAVATRRIGDGGRLSADDEQDLVLEGYLLFSDPLKAGAATAVSALSGVGVRLKMITGDNRHVARHVAEAAGIACAEILTGSEMAGMADRALFHRVTRLDVYAEVTPDQKERIVRALRRHGKVVGYLGDGINDAPALRAADLGISVDGAVAAAREAADVVLLRPDLNVLEQGIVLGRTAFANTLKYIFITTSSNLGNMISMAVASMFLPFLPMLAKQILLNNTLSDLPMLAISTDDVDAEVLRRPGRWDFRSLLQSMLVFGLLSSVFDFVTFGVLLFAVHAQAATFQTAWFLVSLVSELVIILVMRTRGPALARPPGRLLGSIGAVVFITALALPYLPFAGALGLVPLSAEVLATLAAIVLAYGIASEALKRRGGKWPFRLLRSARLPSRTTDRRH